MLYIFSNLPFTEEQLKAKIKLRENDTIILLNKAIPNNVESIRNHKNKYIFLRSFSKSPKDYWGLKTLDKSLYKKVFYIDGKVNNTKKIKYNSLNTKIYPTTGFIAYKYCLQNKQFFRQTRITLVNFYGKNNSIKENKKQIFFSGHDWNLEQKIYKRNKVLMINLLSPL